MSHELKPSIRWKIHIFWVASLDPQLCGVEALSLKNLVAWATRSIEHVMWEVFSLN